MVNKTNTGSNNKKIIIYIVLTLATLAVYWQASRFDFINFDDPVYIMESSYVKSGTTLEGIRWAFMTKHTGLWYPLVWLSFMVDYQIYGLHPGGYHVTNLIFHMLSTLLLFWLFCRMTGAVWKSAFVAFLFALHPLHVESVAWVSERKDVLSAFFWMLTLCLYVYYTEKPVVKRYLPVIFCFSLALMSKPMVVTLPVIMMLLDYWPLNRFQSQKSNWFFWQLKEKWPFFVLSLVLVFITFYTPDRAEIKYLPFSFRLANAPVAAVTYLVKTFWPYNMAFFYPFPKQIPVWQFLATFLFIIFISTIVIVLVKKMPHLFVGWLWYMIMILPVVKIVSVGTDAMADRYHYLPSIGITLMLAWGIPSLIKNQDIRRKYLFPATITLLIFLAVLTWKQCGYWKNSLDLAMHALQVTKKNFMAHNNLASALMDKGQIQDAIHHYNEAIRLESGYADAYYNRGIAYHKLGDYRQAIGNYNQAIQIVPQNSNYYKNRGVAYMMLGYYEKALDDCNKSILLNCNDGDTYNNRAFIYFGMGDISSGCRNAGKACKLGVCNTLTWAKNNGYCL